jgi:hypothetical protein
MPFPDAKYPPERKVMDAWRLALSTIASDCYDKLVVADPRAYEALALAVRDCAMTALMKEDK